MLWTTPACQEGGGHGKIGDGGPLDGGVLPAGALHTDGPGGHHHVTAAHRQVDPPAGAHPDEGVGAQVGQLLHGDGGGGAANAGGDHAHLLPQQRSGVCDILPVGPDMDRVVKVPGDGLTPARIAGQDTVSPHLALGALDMKLPLPRLFVHEDDLHQSIYVLFYHKTGLFSRFLLFMT